jgi:hypothetical protein
MYTRPSRNLISNKSKQKMYKFYYLIFFTFGWHLSSVPLVPRPPSRAFALVVHPSLAAAAFLATAARRRGPSLLPLPLRQSSRAVGLPRRRRGGAALGRSSGRRPPPPSRRRPNRCIRSRRRRRALAGVVVGVPSARGLLAAARRLSLLASGRSRSALRADGRRLRLRVPVAAAGTAAGGSSADGSPAAVRLLLEEQEAAAFWQPGRREGEVHAQRQKVLAWPQQEDEGARRGGRGGHGCARASCRRLRGERGRQRLVQLQACSCRLSQLRCTNIYAAAPGWIVCLVSSLIR